MIDTSITNAPYQPTPLPGRTMQRPPINLWQKIALALVMALAAFMNFFLLGQNGYGNLFYAAGVKSMGDSWHNFFFAAFDPGGFVTVDKPPLGFWLQVLSTKIFGFTPFSIFFPQALCGVLAVLLLYALVRRHFGVNAALLAALVLALSPISVVTNRNNTIDGTLALVLLLAAWAAIHAAEAGKLRWLLLSSVFVGLGFNIKMAEAYLVVPALGLTYLLCAPRKIWVRIIHLLLALLIMLAISLSWAVAVDLTPASQRPYVGSTQDNSEVSLAFGYNGLNRLHIGDTGPAGGRGGARNTQIPQQSSTAQNQFRQRNANAAGTGAANAGTFGGGGRNFGGSTEGPLGLFSASMGGQIGWLLAFALLAILALAWQRRLNLRQDRQQLGLILWGCWLLTMAIFFTFNGSFHQYYMTEMAPGLSAMAGIGLVAMWNDYRRPGWRGWLLPFALALTAAAQINILTGYPAWSWWMSPLIGLLTALVVLALLVFRLKPRLSLEAYISRMATGVLMSVGLLALLLAPTIWAGYAVAQNVENSNPQAGPAGQSGQSFGGQRGGQRTGTYGDGGTARVQGNLTSAFANFMGGGSGQSDPVLISYLEKNQGQTRFLVATPSSNSADSIILSTNQPVMAMGGFSGSDPILTSNSLQSLIEQNTVRFFLLSSPNATNQPGERQFSGRGGGSGGFGRSVLSTWVSSHCTAVPAQDWSSATGKAGAAQTSNQLYDCASLRA